MKDTPILMMPAMAYATLHDLKTFTRRVVDPQPPTWADSPQKPVGPWVHFEGKHPEGKCGHQKCACIGDGTDSMWTLKCPYGQKGDRLWVREEHYQFGHWEELPGKVTKGGKQKWGFIADTEEIRFDAPEVYRKARSRQDPATPAWHKRLARFMPRRFSRSTLEIVSVRVERLNDIGARDILAEGVTDDLVEALLLPAANKCVEVDEYWVCGADESISYCYDCCKKAVEEQLAEDPDGDYRISGGDASEGDSTAFCETCGVRLINSLTDYGASEEFTHFLNHGCLLKSSDDCQSMLSALRTQTWDLSRPSHHSDARWEQTERRQHLMWKACFRLLWESINGRGSWTANPFVWVVEFKRLAPAEGGAA